MVAAQLSEYDPDAEARRAAGNIRDAIVSAGWTISNVYPKYGLPDGVEIDPFVAPIPTQSAMQDGSWGASWQAEIKSNTVADALIDFLHSFHWQARRGYPMDDKGAVLRDPKIVPPDTLLIKVGIYPAVVYIAPPGMKEYADAIARVDEERKTNIQAMRKKREDQDAQLLKNLPPERAAEYKALMKQGREKWEAEDRALRERWSGPCQPLTPLIPYF